MSFRYLLIISLFSMLTSDFAEAMFRQWQEREPRQNQTQPQRPLAYPGQQQAQQQVGPYGQQPYLEVQQGADGQLYQFGYSPQSFGVAQGQPALGHWHPQHQEQHLQPPVPSVVSIPQESLQLGPRSGAVSFSHLIVQRLSGRIADLIRLVGNMAAQISNLEETQKRENRDREKKEEERVAQLEQLRAQLQQAQLQQAQLQQAQLQQAQQAQQMQQMQQMHMLAQLQQRPPYMGWRPPQFVPLAQGTDPVLSDSSSESGSSSPVVVVPIPTLSSAAAAPLKSTAVKRAAPSKASRTSKAPVCKRKRSNMKYVPGAPTEECQGVVSTKNYNNRYQDKDGKIWFVCQYCGRMFERQNAHTMHVNASKKKTRPENTKSGSAQSQKAVSGASNIPPEESEDECEEEEQEESE